MKHFFLIAASIFYCNMYAQHLAPNRVDIDPSITRCDSVVGLEFDGTPMKTIYQYDDNGNRTVSLSYRKQDGKWVNSGKSELTYDDNSNMTSTADYYWENSDWIGTSRRDYTYDVYDNMTAEFRFTWINGEWGYKGKTEFTYDSKSNVTMRINYVYENEQWVNSSKYENSYNSAGIQTNSLYYIWRNNMWCGTGTKHESTRDENGTITTVYYSWKNDKWTETSKTETFYNEQGKQTCLTYYNWIEDEWVPTNKQEYAYDEKGDQTYSARYEYEWKEGEWVGTYKEEQGYDEKLCQVYSVFYNWVENQWVATGKTESIANDTISLQTDFRWENGQWMETRINKRTYNSDHILTGRWNAEKNENNEWITKEEAKVYFDDEGNRVSSCLYLNDDIGNCYYKHETFYDHDLEVGSAYYNWIDGQWVGSGSRHEMIFDEDGNFIIYYELRDGQWTETRRTKYEEQVDSNGRFVGSSRYVWENNHWVGDSKQEYEYDSNGNQISYVNYMWQDDQWVISSYRYYYYSGTPTAVESLVIAPDSISIRKVMQNSKLRIIKDERTYGIGGERIQ